MHNGTDSSKSELRDLYKQEHAAPFKQGKELLNSARFNKVRVEGSRKSVAVGSSLARVFASMGGMVKANGLGYRSTMERSLLNAWQKRSFKTMSPGARSHAQTHANRYTQWLT